MSRIRLRIPCLPKNAKDRLGAALLTVLLTAGACTEACASPAPAQNPALQSTKGLQADIDVLQRTYETMHPGLYRYNTPAQMAANFAALREAYDHDQTLSEAYLALSAFTAKIRCGHSYPNFFNQPDAAVSEVFLHPDRVPFLFRWLDRRMIVTKDFTDAETLVPGTEILAIDDIPVASILDRLMAYSRADGGNDAKRIANLELNGGATFEAFDIYFPLVFPPKGLTRELRIRAPNSAADTRVTVATITPELRKQSLTAQETALHGGDAPIWTLEKLDSRSSLLRMPSWAVYDSKWDWKTWLDQRFDALIAAGVPNLVIDLRDNEGGSGVGDEIIARLIASDLPLPQFRHLVRYRKAPEDLLPYLDTWDRSFRDWGDAAIDEGNGFYRLTRYDDDARGTVIKARGKRYRGKVWVLVDASNSSATFEFERVAQSRRLATLVGQATGGNRRGINGGAFFFLRLPNSTLEVDLPLIGQFPVELAADEGLVPDIQVAPRIEDIAAGRDTALAKVRALIAQPRRRG